MTMEPSRRASLYLTLNSDRLLSVTVTVWFHGVSAMQQSRLGMSWGINACIVDFLSWLGLKVELGARIDIKLFSWVLLS